MDDIQSRARGRWRGILLSAGVSSNFLKNKQGPCPLCSGVTRFRFDDKDGRGTWICNHCGAGNGFALIMKLRGCDFAEAARVVEDEIGKAPVELPKPRPNADRQRERMTELWARAKPLTPEDAAGRYLASRGIAGLPPPTAVRFVPELRHWEGRVPAYFPTMVSKMVAPANDSATLHRTILEEAGCQARALGKQCKLFMPGRVPPGGAVRLASPGETLGVAEGIETALSAAQLAGVPVWACLSAGSLLKWEPPPGVVRVIIFGDWDKSFCGQNVAYSLAYRLTTTFRSLSVEVQFPPAGLKDFNDALQSRR